MQMLYSMSRDSGLKYDDMQTRYWDRINKSFQLYLFNLLYFTRIAEYARQDAERRNAKLLPSEEDLHFVPKLSDNRMLESITKNEELKALFRYYQLEEKIDEDTVRLIYTEFAREESYLEYVLKKETTAEDHQAILLELYKHCIQHEHLDELMEDHYPQWIDDKSLIVGAVKKTLKALPSPAAFFEEYRPPKETTREFGETLLRTVVETDAKLLQLIEPTLKNWDADRVAIIDMILLKMALTELMTFSTIPSKVTLNEFVEISKLYSTEKSKDFINGILDRLMKKLNKEGKIKKEGRGLLE